MKKTLLIIAVVVLCLYGGCRMTYEIVRKPTPAELAEPGVLAEVTGVEFPSLLFDECRLVEGGKTFSFPWKTYYWVSASYRDTTHLDVFYASIDSAIAAGDTLWRKADERLYKYDSHWLDIVAGDNGLDLELEYGMFE